MSPIVIALFLSVASASDVPCDPDQQALLLAQADREVTEAREAYITARDLFWSTDWEARIATAEDRDAAVAAKAAARAELDRLRLESKDKKDELIATKKAVKTAAQTCETTG